MSASAAQPQLAVDNTPPGRVPRRPTLFFPGFVAPEEFPTLGALARRLHALGRPWPMRYRPGAAAYPGFDGFPSVTAYAGGEFLALVAVPGLLADQAMIELEVAMQGVAA